MSGPSLIFSSIFPVCFRAAAIVCFMSSESEITAETSSELLTRHEPSRGAGRRRRLFVKFSEYFLPPLLFSEKCWPLVSQAGLGWLSVKSLYPGRLIMTGLRGCLSSYIIITPKLDTGWLELERQTQFWENNLGSQCISCESLEYLNTPLGKWDDTWC